MSTVSEYVLVQKYNFISEQLTKHMGISLYFICLFGSVMNILTFLQHTYHTSACSFYLLVASACDFVHLTLHPLSNILQYGFHYDWTINSLTYCRTKSYFAFVFTASSGTLTTLASLSQYLLSSEKSTRWHYARHHIGVRWTKIVFVFWFLVSIPVIFCSNRFKHVFDHNRLICSNPARHITCYAVRLIHVCLLNGFLPPLIMMIFGFLIYNNVRHLQQRSKMKSFPIRRLNQQLTSMLVLQSIESIFTSIPFAIFNSYWLKPMHHEKPLSLQARENLIHQIVYLLFWSNYTSFFVYLCSSEIFRDQWTKVMTRLISCRYGRSRKRHFVRIS